MLGVVLWCDSKNRKAVIWCEDQGDLAFYTQDTAAGDSLHPGDWVQFTLKLAGNLRLAEQPVVLDEPGCPDLADRLAALAIGGGSSPSLAAGGSGGKVVPLRANSSKPRRSSEPRRSGSA